MGGWFRWGAAAALAVALSGVPAIAQAAPGDLDPAYGTAGVGKLAPKLGAFGAPLAGADGKATVAGFDPSGSTRIVLGRLTAGGVPDTTFDGDGLLDTGNNSSFKRGATARLADGRVYLAVGQGGGKFGIERRLVSGALDRTFDSDGRLTVQLGGSVQVPASILPLDGDKLLLAAANDGSGNSPFTVAKVDPAAIGDLDKTYGGALTGRFETTFGGKARSGAMDLVALGNGQVLAVGTAGNADYSVADVAMVRLNANGTADPAFGTKVVDVTGGAEQGLSVAADATGAFVVAGRGPGQGFVARFTSLGVLDTGFGGGDGVVNAGFAPAGEGVEPVDVVRDGQGRLLVAATRRPGVGGGAPAVVRLLPSGALDTGWSGDGRADVPACDGASAAASGLSSTGTRVLLALSCGSAGTVAVASFLSVTAVEGAELTLSPDVAPAGHEVTRYANYPAQSMTLSAVDSQAAGFRQGGYRQGGFRQGGYRQGGFRQGGFRQGGFRQGGFRQGPFRTEAIAQAIPLSNLPLWDPDRPEVSWAWVLADTPLADRPLETVTLQDVFDLRATGAPAQFVTRYDSLTLDLAETSRTPLQGLTITAVVLDGPLSRVAPPQGFASWCAFLAAPRPDGKPQPLTCANGADPSRTTLAELEFRGDDLTRAYESPIPLTPPTDVTSDPTTFIGRFALTTVDLSRMTVGARPAADFAALLAATPPAGQTLAQAQAANPTGFSTKTIADLVAHVAAGRAPGVTSLTLPDALAGVLLPEAYNVEGLGPVAFRALLDRADVRDTQVHTATVRFDADCGLAALGYTVGLDLPDAFRVVPGKATVSEDGGTARTLPAPSGTDSARGVDVAWGSAALGICAGTQAGARTVRVVVPLEPQFRLGDADGRVKARIFTGSATTPEAERTAQQTRADDGRDTDGGAPAGAKAVEPGDTQLAWISSAGDLDYFKLTIPADLPVGTRISAVTGQQALDADLVVLGPSDGVPTLGYRQGGYRQGGYRQGGYRQGGLPDAGAEPGAEPGVLEPDIAQDLPIPDVPGMSVRATSVRRGTAAESATVRVTEADRGKTFIAQVSGFNGARSDDPVVFRWKSQAPPAPKPCIAARTGLNTPTAGAFPALPLPSTTQTLIVTNVQRLRALYPAADVTAMLSKLNAFAARSDVQGVVLPVESAPNPTGDPQLDARGAYVAWDADPCSVEKANLVSARINAIVDRARQGLGGLRNVVVVGPDEVVPQGRTLDLTTMANEDTEADAVAFGGKDNAISRAMRLGHVLTDDHFADTMPREGQGGGQSFVPTVAIGRLLETPLQVSAQLDQYTATDGRLNPQTTRVTGYDFFDDSASAQSEALARLGAPQSNLIDPPAGGAAPWTAAQARSLINTTTPGVFALNAHFNENEAQPSANFYGRETNVVRSTEITPAPGSLLFTMGCHAGLPLSDGLVTGAGDVADPKLDWPQQIAARRTVYIASTGYGLGDDAANALTERLLTYFAQELGPAATAGQALMLAKQRYASELLLQGPLPPYDAKASSQLTFYGLPMYRVGTAGTQAPSALPPAPKDGALEVQQVPFDSGTITHEERTAEDGKFYVAMRDGKAQDPLVEHFRPIEPKLALDVTRGDDGLRAVGAIPTALASSSQRGFDPTVVRPLALSGPDRQAEPELKSGFFPVDLLSVDQRATPAGQRDVLTLATGQFRRDGTPAGDDEQRLYSRIAGVVYRSNTRDMVPPVSSTFRVAVQDGTVVFRAVTATPDVDRFYVLYRTDGGPEWYGLDLTPGVTPGTWVGGEDLAKGTKVVESGGFMKRRNGVTGATWNKGPGYNADGVQSGAGDPKGVYVAPQPVPPSRWFNAPVTVALDKGARVDQAFTYRVDDGPTQLYTAPFTISTEGRHIVTFTAADGTVTEFSVKIDLTKPLIAATTSPEPNAAGWNRGPVTVAFACEDALSGVASCGPDQTVTAQGTTTVTGTATDLAGNQQQAQRTVKIDSVAPEATITPPFLGLLVLGAQLRGTATDDRSGVAAVETRWTPVLGDGLLGTTQTRATTLDCNAARTDCDWTGGTPGLGLYRVVAVATDVAGGTGQSPARSITVTTQEDQESRTAEARAAEAEAAPEG